MSARELRNAARLRAQRHRDLLSQLIEDAKVCDEMKDALRLRLRNLWIEASLAMTLIESAPPPPKPQGETT